MAVAYLALGGNQGDVPLSFRKACAALDGLPGLGIKARSSLYATAPWGVTNQPDFINACLKIETDLPPHVLLEHCLNIERALGRTRSRSARWGPRPLDIDILAYGNVAMQDVALKLPHPELFNRAFVLVPLGEIAPQLCIGGRSVANAAQACGMDGITKLTAGW